jgi:hypothetical protein
LQPFGLTLPAAFEIKMTLPAAFEVKMTLPV